MVHTILVYWSNMSSRHHMTNHISLSSTHPCASTAAWHFFCFKSATQCHLYVPVLFYGKLEIKGKEAWWKLLFVVHIWFLSKIFKWNHCWNRSLTEWSPQRLSVCFKEQRNRPRAEEMIQSVNRRELEEEGLCLWLCRLSYNVTRPVDREVNRLASCPAIKCCILHSWFLNNISSEVQSFLPM